MDPKLELISEQSEREFGGHSFNGSSLLETCSRLNAEEASAETKYEGYTAWEILVHCVYYKYFVLRFLGLAAPLEPYPWSEDSFPPFRATSPEDWKETLAYARKTQDLMREALAALDAKRLGERIEAWDCTLREALVWLPTHDSYHTGQLRSLGYPQFRSPKS